MIQDAKKSEIKVVGTVQDRMPQINEISITEQPQESQLNIKRSAASNFKKPFKRQNNLFGSYSLF